MDLDTSAYSTSKEYVDTSYLRASKKGVFESDDELSVDHEDEDDEDDAESMGIRRSRRKTKGKRLQFWKNERSVYMNGKMMGLLIADPTPAKPKRKRVDTSKTSENNKKKKSTLSQLSKKLHTESESDKESEVPPSIPKKYKYIDR